MRSRWRIACAGLWFSIVLSAQVRVTGKVTNDTAAPLPNVSSGGAGSHAGRPIPMTRPGEYARG